MIEYEVVPYKTSVVFTRSRKEWEAAVQAVEHDPGDEYLHLDAEGITYRCASGGFIVGVFRRDAGVLAHECAHVALSILASRGIDVQEANQEPFCYLLEHLVDYFTKAKP